MKVLLCAYRCQPGNGSEPGVGWNWASQVARYHQVWVITRGSNRAAIEKQLALTPMPTLHFIYHDSPSWERLLTVGVHHLHYALWQLTAIRTVRRLHAAIGFDLCHHVTYAAHRFPSALAWLDVPFIWGPVGGGERAPISFYRELGWRGFVGELLRDLHNIWIRWDPFVWYTRRRAHLTLTTTHETQAAVGRGSAGRVAVFPTIGVEPQRIQAVQAPGDSGFRVLFVGNLLAWKGVTLALKAFAAFRRTSPHTSMTIVGDGSDRLRLEALSRELNIQDAVRFVGRLDRPETRQQYLSHDVFLYPSLHDSGAMVVLEAMSAGLAVICLDLGGPAVSLTEDCGIKVRAINPQQAVRDMAESLRYLAANPGVRRELGQRALERVHADYEWSQKGDQLENIYQTVAQHVLRGARSARGPSTS